MKLLIKSFLWKVMLLFVTSVFLLPACEKSSSIEDTEEIKDKCSTTVPFDLDVILGSDLKKANTIKFRQNPDAAKIITLDICVQNLKPNHEYLLQRAVDAVNVIDCNCTSTTWLTLGKGLVPQSILTDKNGNGNEALWRDVTAIASGAAFDIHFRVIDAKSMEVVLTSACYQYAVR